MPACKSGKCPVCGGEVAFDLRVDLDSNVALSGENVIRLSPQQAVVLHILAQGGWVTMDQIVKQNYGADPAETADQIMKVTISQLRKLLRPIGWAIIGQYNLGYCLIRRSK